MSFLNPFFFIGALTLAVPILIHLVRREKSEIVPFSSLMFLLKVPKRAIRQQKLRNLLLMALRLLILALLVTAFARPYFTQEVAEAITTDQGRGIVMMLDNSYSMRYGTTFERMKNEAAARIDAMNDGDRMALIAFNDQASVVAMPTSDQDELRAAVDSIEPSHGATRFYEAFTLADRLFGQLAGQDKELLTISDFQRNGWNRSSRESVVGADVEQNFIDLGMENSTNIGIDSLNLDQTTFSRVYSGRVIARIHNHRADEPVSVPVSITINDREVGRSTIDVLPNSTSLAEFSGFDLPLGFSKGSVRIHTEDPLLVDNEFLFTVERRERLNVLVVDAGLSRQSFFLREAFTSAPDLPFAVTIVQAQNLTTSEIANHQVVIINDVPRLSDGVRNRMDELRQAGQGQIVILGENVETGWWNNFESLPVRLSQKIFVSNDRGQPFFSVTDHDRNHAIFKPFETSSRVALGTAQFFAYVETEPKEGSVVLAKLENGSPAITESSEEDRRLLVLSSSVDSKWNDLPLKPAFLPLFHEMVSYLSRYSETRGWYTLGEGVPLVGGLETASAAIVDPQGQRQALGDLQPGQQRFFTPEIPGFYEARIGRESALFAVNPPSAEGNLERMLPEDLLASVQSTQAESQRVELFAGDDQEQYAQQQLSWWYLLLVAILAGIAEIYMANRRAYETKRGTA